MLADRLVDRLLHEGELVDPARELGQGGGVLAALQQVGFELAGRRRKCTLKVFGVFFAQGFRRVSVPGETLETGELAFFGLEEWTVALRTRNRDLIAWRLTGWVIGIGVIVHF